MLYDTIKSSQAIKARMDELNVSVSALAKSTGLVPGTIENILRGTRPGMSTLCKICEALAITFDQAMGVSAENPTACVTVYNQVPVVCSFPHWETDSKGRIYCSACRQDSPSQTKTAFCPSCGQVMCEPDPGQTCVQEVHSAEYNNVSEEPEPVDWTPPTADRKHTRLFFLQCSCGKRFVTWIEKGQTSKACRECGEEIPLDKNMTKAEFTCPGCNTPTWFSTNILDPEFDFKCRCGTVNHLTYNKETKAYSL